MHSLTPTSSGQTECVAWIGLLRKKYALRCNVEL